MSRIFQNRLGSTGLLNSCCAGCETPINSVQTSTGYTILTPAEMTEEQMQTLTTIKAEQGLKGKASPVKMLVDGTIFNHETGKVYFSPAGSSNKEMVSGLPNWAVYSGLAAVAVGTIYSLS